GAGTTGTDGTTATVALPPTPPTAASCAAIPARPAVVLDIDETALSNYIDTFGDPTGGSAGYAGVSVTGQGTALAPVLDLYREARRRGVAVFFITARPGIIQPVTEANLRRVGYDAWDGLTFKNDLTSEKDVHKTAERRKVEAAGYRILLNVGDQQTDIDGGVAERAFKLPNPFY
ncbi:HAD family acid phosphatase, partial [Patulibacter sp. S7RM1-6]